MDSNIVRSPIPSLGKNIHVPSISLPEFLFQALDMNYDILKDQIWVADVLTGASYTFSEIKPLTRKIASALTKLGFKKGDVLFYSTYNMTLIYAVHIGVWMCGGVVRGCYQKDEQKEFERQMREVSARFILCDNETEESMKGAAGRLGWPVKLLSIGGKVDGATAIEDMIANEDCSGFPHHVKINSKEDACFVVQTNGSTGIPKGVLYSHSGLITLYSHLEQPKRIGEERILGKTGLTITGNFLISSYILSTSSIVYGFSLLSISKFDQKKLISQIVKLKPESALLYPYVANAFAKSDELSKLDFSFLKCIFSGGSVFNMETAKQLATKIPHVKIKLGYGMSEIIFHSCSSIENNLGTPEERVIAGLKVNMLDGNWTVSCGSLLPHAEAKIVDPNLKCTVGRNIKGNLWVRSPCMMKGYLKPESEKGYISPIDEDGWFETGDIAYFDDTDNLYIVDRSSSTFKYFMHWVSPSEIESIIAEHPAVSSVGVIGIPNTVSTSAARAYVVRKSGYKATEVEIKQFVAGKTIDYKHLHGGVVFIDQLPETKGGKVDRAELLRMALAELHLES